ncbi:MAG: GLPGLI family protein [Polaribacter sp.]|nr:GLPGLI family protein [Polaribacter sp.]
MKIFYATVSFLFFSLLISNTSEIETKTKSIKDFQGKATYISKAKMELGNWGARLTEVQKKQIEARMKNRLEKTYILTFNTQESFFKEDDKIDAISGATDSWGKYFSPGDQYKNTSTNTQIQHQEFYGKDFLVKDKLQPIDWKLGDDTKMIGDYVCLKATAMIPANELTWYAFSWDKLNNREKKEKGEEQEVAYTVVEAWYSIQIPVSHGPQEFWGLPGLILEVSYDNTTFLCSELVLNTGDKITINAPSKGKVVTKVAYQDIISKKMQEFRDNRSGRGR